mmetsp:Transcript_11338/g.11036  ORF Transcript_11338/g.11036 Transcript_11338/m.11036 type:complete len:99 (-) Transcript_11338:1158-1454(-)
MMCRLRLLTVHFFSSIGCRLWLGMCIPNPGSSSISSTYQKYIIRSVLKYLRSKQFEKRKMKKTNNDSDYIETLCTVYEHHLYHDLLTYFVGLEMDLES